MSKVIGFDARGFKIDPTCKSNNVANRMFVTDALGNNVEVYEIGDHNYNWTQISYEMPVGKDEDYEFVFAMTGDIDSRRLNDQAKCSFIIVPLHEKFKAITVDEDGVINEGAGTDDSEKATDEDWENRYQYSLIRREYRPTMEKLWNGESLRFYRIPFNTGDADRIRFVFLAFTQPYKVFPVKNFDEYAKLPDYNMRAGNFQGKFGPGFGPDNKRGFGPDFGPDERWFGAGRQGYKGWNGPKDIRDIENVINNIGNLVNTAVREAMNNLDKFQKGGFGSGPDFSKKHGAGGKRIISPEMLTLILKKLDEDDGILDLANCDIKSGPDFIPGNFEDAEPVDDITFSLDNSVMDGDAFYRIMSKVGSCCKVNANNCMFGSSGHGPELAGSFVDRADDTEFHFVNSQISEAAFISILSKVGDCCKVDLTNSDIKDFDEIKDLSGFCFDAFDDTEIRLDNTRISQRFYQALVRACGSESKITGRAVIY